MIRRFRRRAFSLEGRSLRARRGSTLLVVLALLSVLVLLATTLAFTSRIESISAKNFGRSVQNRTAALTGVQYAASFASRQLPNGATGAMEAASLGVNISARNAFYSGQQLQPQEVLSATGTLTDTSHVEFRDASARVNINTADRDTLRRLLQFVIDQSGAEGNAERLSEAIVRYRLGPDGAPGVKGLDDNLNAKEALGAEWGATGPELSRPIPVGPAGSLSSVRSAADLATQAEKFASKGESTVPAAERRTKTEALLGGVDDGDEYVADLRLPAFGDDRRFQAVSDLKHIKGFPPRLVEALEPYTTVFSVTQVTRPGQTAAEFASILDLNRATAEEIYTALLDLYGTTKEDMLLRQFAVNIVDWRDPDSVPTSLPTNELFGKVLGLERTPVITEVYPDSLTIDERGDDGQFLELYNPWDTTFELSGWTVKVGGRRHPLTGRIGPRNFLIITDDFDNSRDPYASDDLSGQGSLYDIFKVVSNNSNRRILEIPDMDLPHGNGVHFAEVYDAEGNLVDQFRYEIRQRPGTVQSFQRPNPVVRDVVLAGANPFALHPADLESTEKWRTLAQLPANIPFVSVLDLFHVFAGTTGSSADRWAFPELVGAGSLNVLDKELAASPTRLDARVIDLFHISVTPRRTAEEIRSAQRVYQTAETSDVVADRHGFPLKATPTGKKPNKAALEALAWQSFMEAPVGLFHGRINVNSALEPALVAAGFTPQVARFVVQQRHATERKALQVGESSVLYGSLSAVLTDDRLFPGLTERQARLAAFETIAKNLTTSSRAFLVEGQALSVADNEGLRKSGARIGSIISYDRGRPEMVGWKFSH